MGLSFVGHVVDDVEMMFNSNIFVTRLVNWFVKHIQDESADFGTSNNECSSLGGYYLG
jgi:hypothetical protein